VNMWAPEPFWMGAEYLSHIRFRFMDSTGRPYQVAFLNELSRHERIRCVCS